MMKFLLACVLVQLAWAKALTKPCCVPDQWEAVLGGDQVTSENGQSMRTTRVTNFLSTDYTKKKMAIVSLADAGKEHSWGKTIYDFAKKKQYVISEDKCTVYPLTFEMTSPCIPASAEYLGSSYLGGKSRISFDSWSYGLPEYNSNITISVSQEDCTPLVEEVMSKRGNFQSIMIGAFASFTLGIKDPNVFVPPPSCQQEHFKLAGASVGHSAHPVQ